MSKGPEACIADIKLHDAAHWCVIVKDSSGVVLSYGVEPIGSLHCSFHELKLSPPDNYDWVLEQ